ncbi:DUF1702 family protein [Actinospica robiniae]|uniref:DUF1702 family protein n=1 Tax=Actinospica robiniae TaxID=304901 RepID=UPI000413F203|nr:DUF1702 family protein [Actinospica robiniae]
MRALRQVRRRVLTPPMSETKFATRGFHAKDDASRELLETVGASFLTGYGLAAESRGRADVESGVRGLEREFQGFAYEGAAMAFAVRDGLALGTTRHLQDFLKGEAEHHRYMVYVGAGWAMARLPRLLWPTIRMPDPLLRWLALDGYGFHQAYFRTDDFVRKQRVETRRSWPVGEPFAYANRAIDQGIGRAMWFVVGADADRAADLADGFDPARRSDLYAGLGLAATYAGGAHERELKTLRERAGADRRFLGQGAAFAAAARVEAGLETPHTELAAQLLCGVSAAEAARICTMEQPNGAETWGSQPSYEQWRLHIAERMPA